MPTIRGFTTGPDLLEHIVEDDEDDVCVECGIHAGSQSCRWCDAPMCEACYAAGDTTCSDCPKSLRRNNQ